MFLEKSKKISFRIGIVYPETNGWLGGSKYLRILISALGNVCRAEDSELYVLSERSGPLERFPGITKIAPIEAPRYFRGEGRLRQLVGLPDKSAVFGAAREHQISVLLPICTSPASSSDLKSIGWIPDFQHVYLPEFFSQATRDYRDYTFRLLAQRCTLVMLSSCNALEHFSAFAPKYAHKARVVSFPSLFAFESPPTGSSHAQQKFKIPAKFALVVNQFWRHKNHEVVIEALRQLWYRGSGFHVVMIGLPADGDPNNETISRILQGVASAGLGEAITVLGRVTDSDLVDLLRAAAVVLQPSRFEGWSTVVQECKALGRPLICSDIPIHHEQAPDALGFFPCERPEVLADLLAARWPNLEPGPDPATEKRALAVEQEFGRRYGRSLLKICQEAQAA